MLLLGSLGTLGVGGLTWLFGLYNTVKGWKMSNAYTKLSDGRKIQQLIEDVIPYCDNEQIEKNKISKHFLVIYKLSNINNIYPCLYC